MNQTMPLGRAIIDIEGCALTLQEQRRLAHPQVGGVILFARNFESIAQLVALTASIHAVRTPALLIAVEMKANPIFAQTRVGRNQKPFTLYKLRTMSPDTLQEASHKVPASSVTKLGRILRRFKIDELPQLACIIRGDMSLVGPRPCLFNQDELIRERDRQGVFAVLPGITGLAQIRGIDMSTPVVLAQLDKEYIEAQSVVGDLKILWETVIGRGRGDAIRE